MGPIYVVICLVSRDILLMKKDTVCSPKIVPDFLGRFPPVLWGYSKSRDLGGGYNSIP